MLTKTLSINPQNNELMDISTFEITKAGEMKHPPYHLRTNKAVDRLLLADVIRALGSTSSFSDFTYYSLAGPFLEDLRIMDHFFSEMKLISLETNEQTWKRQTFNQFCSRLTLKKSNVADFLLHEYSPKARDVFWLDYTDLSLARFNEFQRLLTQVIPESIIRITLRAEPEINLQALRDRISEEEYLRLLDELIRNFENEFERIIPPDIKLADAFQKMPVFVRLVQQMIKIAASQALDTSGSEIDFLPVQSTRYNDNTQMISVTGVVCLRTNRESIHEKLNSLRFANFDWREPDKIDIPALTIKERLHLERFLPIQEDQEAGEMLFKALDYMIDDGIKKSKLQLSHYAACHRSYPNFVQISI